MISKTVFGRRLKRARERQELTQKEVADRLERTPNAIGNWEQGLSYPSAGQIDDLCSILKVSPDWLFGTPGDPRR